MNSYETYAGYELAFRSIRRAKNVLWWLVAAAIIIQLVSFVLVDFVGVLESPQAELLKAETQPAVTATLEQQDEMAPESDAWRRTFNWLLPGTKFLSLVLTLLLVMTILFAVKLSLIGHLGGVGGFISAFYWSLILLAIITPWQQVFVGSFVRGATYNLGELLKLKDSWTGEGAGLIDKTLYYVRFIVYPAVALLMWLVVQLKFARGYRQSLPAEGTPMMASPEQPPIEPIG